MTQTEKDLLLKDLCSRLPYNNLKVRGVFLVYNKDIDRCVYEECDREFNHQHLERYETLKPYLFPISSMTEEQKEEYENITFKDGFLTVWTTGTYDWLNKNHFDYRGLIEKGLAINATGKNIY